MVEGLLRAVSGAGAGAPNTQELNIGKDAARRSGRRLSVPTRSVRRTSGFVLTALP